MGNREMVLLQESQIGAAARTLARAFMDDPLQTYTFPDEAERAHHSPAHFEALVRYGLLAGEVWCTEGDVDAVGIWWPPERTQIDEGAVEASGLARLPEVLGAGPMERFMTVIDYVEALHKQDVPAPHWYAMVLGVAPEFQGQGLGGLLLRTVFEKADAAGVPCYLETCQPRNVAFYRKHGFQTLREGIVPGTQVAYWTFLRSPAR